MVRTRFAPSPTGYLHIGGLRTALYAYLIAKKNKGTFILRIEDTDQERFVEGAVEMIIRTLDETGLKPDEGPHVGGPCGPYVQSERRAIYKEQAEALIARGGAYRCFCSKERLETLRGECEKRGETFKYDKHCLKLSPDEARARADAGEPYVVRQDVPQTGTTSFEDVIFGAITVENATLDDTVLLKSDGLPTYNFANVVDDYLMGITHVVRGTEYLSSSPKYNLLYTAMGWEVPVYIHVPPVMRDAQHKLSKRHGDASYDDFIQKGYLKEAIMNYIALLGWSPGTNQEMFTLEELIEAFDIAGISKAPAIFDIDKLTWLNAQYIRALTPEAFNAHARKYYKEALPPGEHDEALLARILQPRTEKFTDIPPQLDFVKELPAYTVELYTHKKMKTDAAVAKAVLETALPVLAALDTWSEQAVHDALFTLIEALGMKNGQVLYPVRIALCGKQVTPGGAAEAAALLGREESLRRLEIGLGKLGVQ
ncbi:MAG: glutamate--tRNA ligase [Bacillota bacterium]